MSKSSQLKRVLLHLARTKAFPEGSARHGYEFVAPIDASGHLDSEAWKVHKRECSVRRFWAGEPEQIGRLVHRAGGAGGATWLFDYDVRRDDDDEPGFKLGSHRIMPGEYLSIRGDDGTMQTFRVVAVTPA